MSLQVWLPLNGNLENKGLTNVTATNNGATVDNNGKIGKCYKFNGSSSYITLSPSVSLNNDHSICCWIDLTNINSVQYFISFNPGGIRYSNSDNAFLYYCQGTSLIWSYTKVNKFVHVAFVCKSNIITLYVDGQKIGNSQSLSSRSVCDGLGRRSDGYYYNGKLNDFRIYDHALSPKEVKEISKGLILHYKLDDKNIISRENLINNLGAGAQCTISNNIVNVSGNNSDTYFYIKTSRALTLNKLYRISCIGNFGSGVVYNFPIGSQSNTSQGLLKVQNGYCSLIFIANQTIVNAGTSIILDDSGRTPGTGTISSFVLEELNDIYDCSGYQNNGTIIGALNINNDTPRYNSNSLFSATETNYITVPYQGLQGPYSNKIWTITFWINTQQQGNRHMIIGMVGNYNTNIELSTSNTLRIYWAGTPDWSPGITCPINTWVHIAIVITSTYIKAYKDGVLIGTNNTAPNWAGCSSNFLIGSDQRIGSYFLGAKLSDFRIYCTELSLDDIKELYNNPANIDNFGNMLSFEFDEEIVSKQEILKTGITKINNFIEFNNRIKVLSNGSVFIQLLHHNNPTSNLFKENNCWLYNDNNNLYSALILLKNSEWINNLSEYEFLVCEKLESSSTENQFRWKQTSNPALSSSVTGYTLISGNPSYNNGLLNKGTYGAMHNGNTWWCCCGSYTAYSGGIPGFWGVVKSGYLDLYIKIPEDILKGGFDNFVKFYKKSILTNQLMEK